MIIEARSRKQFFELIQKGIKLIIFQLPLSQPCLIQEPELKAFSEEVKEKLNIIKVNAQDIPSLAQQYSVQAIPTILLFRDSREVKRFIGVQSKDLLLQAVNNLSVDKGS